MATLKLNINEKVLDKVLWLLSHFSKEEVEIIHDDPDFLKHQKEIQDELGRMDRGEAKFISLDELDRNVRQAIGSPAVS